MFDVHLVEEIFLSLLSFFAFFYYYYLQKELRSPFVVSVIIKKKLSTDDKANCFVCELRYLSTRSRACAVYYTPIEERFVCSIHLHTVKLCPCMLLTGSPATSHSFVRCSISIYTNIYRYTICVTEAATLPYFDQLLSRLTFHQRNPWNFQTLVKAHLIYTPLFKL